MNDLNNHFTCTIVGQPMELILGVPTAGSGEPQWVGYKAKPEVEASPALSTAPPPDPPKIGFPWPGKNVPLKLVLPGIVLGFVAISAALYVSSSRTNTPSVPQKMSAVPINQPPASTPALSNISVEPAAFPASLAVSGGVRPAPTDSVFAAPFAAAAPVVVAAKAKESEKEKDRIPAVVLDKPDESVKAPDVVAIKPVAPAAPAKDKPAAAAKAVVAKAEAAPVAPTQNSESQPPVTVVDIAKDGSYVLVSNPKTRLPEKFAVGQKIHTGEVIKKIDPAAGKVQLTSRTIGMQ